MRIVLSCNVRWFIQLWTLDYYGLKSNWGRTSGSCRTGDSKSEIEYEAIGSCQGFPLAKEKTRCLALEVAVAGSRTKEHLIAS